MVEKINDLKWTLFKDGVPSESCAFITDFKEIWITKECRYYVGKHPDWAWADIPIPEVPEKPYKLHSCLWNKTSNEWFCDEIRKGFLELVGPNRVNDRIFVKFCPFCGYKPGD